jgi:hypothetical protein
LGDFAREYGRIAALFAGAALLLSLLIGLLSRNPFSVVILRAFLLAILFAGLGAGAKAAVNRWLPGVGERSEGSGNGAEERAAPHAVDIVLPGEGYTAEGSSEDAATDAEEVPSELGGGDDGAVEELEEAGEGGAGDGEETEAQPSPRAQGRRTSSRAGKGASSGEDLPTAAISAADRDGLPDISALGEPSGPSLPPDSRGAAGAGTRRPGGGRPGGERPEDALKGSLGSEDPEVLARAIRTVLKKDEKG